LTGARLRRVSDLARGE